MKKQACGYNPRLVNEGKKLKDIPDGGVFYRSKSNGATSYTKQKVSGKEIIYTSVSSNRTFQSSKNLIVYVRR